MAILDHKSKLFGTDGIRGKVGDWPILPEVFFGMGRACCHWLIQKGKPLKIAVGWDTRESGPELAQAFMQGFASCIEDVSITALGVCPTPTIAFFVEHKKFSLGISITASHNPYTDNGLKVFKWGGCKLTNEEEIALEKLYKPSAKIEYKDLAIKQTDACNYYIKSFLKKHHNPFWEGKKIVLDTANGATTYTSLPLLRALGFEVVSIGAEPNGKNINEHCGSEHCERVGELVKETGAWLGFAHDGDGDRIVVFDEKGERLDGDELLGILALNQLENANNPHSYCVIVTNQSNSGLDQLLQRVQINVVRTDVGDREVFYGMLANDAYLGGECSGHIILRDQANTGDGLRVIFTILDLAQKAPLTERKTYIELLPKVEKSLVVHRKPSLQDLAHLQQKLNELSSLNGRVQVRYSGTENKLRLLVEAPTIEDCNERLQDIIEAAKQDFEDQGVVVELK